MTKRITIVGGGFAGVFAALGAAAEIRQLGRAHHLVVELVSPENHLTIRPRLYEADLRGARVDMTGLLAPLGVRWLSGRLTPVNGERSIIEVLVGDDRRESWPIDALVLACGSVARTPAHWRSVHDVDTWTGALRLQQHLQRCDAGGESDEFVRSAIVIGGGFTGLETAAELVGRLRRLRSCRPGPVSVVLLERSHQVAPEYGPRARAHIQAVLCELGIHCRAGSNVVDVDAEGTVTLADGDQLRAGTTVWTGGLMPPGLESDLLGASGAGPRRLAVDQYLRTAGAEHVFAAGDIAAAEVRSSQLAPMSCQHAMPQGTVAGRNAVRALLGLELTAYQQPRYITCLDLGDAGSLLTSGFARDNIIAAGDDAKSVKRMINRGAIYPPLDGDAAAFAAAGRIDAVPSAAEVTDDEAWAQALLRLARARRVPDRAAQAAEAQRRLERAKTAAGV